MDNRHRRFRKARKQLERKRRRARERRLPPEARTRSWGKTLAVIGGASGATVAGILIAESNKKKKCVSASNNKKCKCKKGKNGKEDCEEDDKSRTSIKQSRLIVYVVRQIVRQTNQKFLAGDEIHSGPPVGVD
jgi:hypothetical protein